MGSFSTNCFIIFAILWEVAVGLLFGFFILYEEQSILTLQTINTFYAYNSNSITTALNFQTNSTQTPFPFIVVAFALIIITVGFSMVAGYIEKASVSSMAFTLLILAFTIQNFFIYRDFFQSVGMNDPNGSYNFVGSYYRKVGLTNWGNDLTNKYSYSTASFMDAVGAALAMIAGYSAVIGRIGFGEVFFLTWIGTFAYELNSQLLWRLYLPDNGYALRSFGFGGMLGLVSSLVLGRQTTNLHPNYKSNYNTMAFSFLGSILVWCAFPILILGDTFTSSGNFIAMIGQVNIWFSLAASVLGAYTASAFLYKKFCVHDIIFSSITGAIAYSPCAELNYNPGAALAIGYVIGFTCSIAITNIKNKINSTGVLESNSVIINFIFPSFCAAIFACIMQAINQGSIVFTDNQNIINTSLINRAGDRSNTVQAGWQIVAWGISIGIGAVAGLVIGLIYRLINSN